MLGFSQILMITLILFDLSINIFYHGKRKPNALVRCLLFLIPVESLILYSGNFWSVIGWPQAILSTLYLASVVVYVFYRKEREAIFNGYLTFVTQAALIFLYYAGGFFG